MSKIKQALISVSDKSGLIDFAQFLAERDVEIISTGGTAKAMRDAGLNIIEASQHTGFPEILEGRVKTLHPLIHGGILARREDSLHLEALEKHAIEPIDLVVVNLYPFEEKVSSGADFNTCIENVDIGGPTMIRSAAKNMGWVGVAINPQDYSIITNELNTNGALSFDTRKILSSKAFGHTAQYDTIIHNYLKDEKLSENFSITFQKHSEMRYGENPHQSAASYKLPSNNEANILNAIIHQGKKLSYNNIMDADGALACVREFDEPACVVVKHANPCGVAVGNDLLDVYNRAFNADSLSAFGGIIALNRTCTPPIAEGITTVFVEIVLAPSFDLEALDILKKKKNLRVLELGNFEKRNAKLEVRNVDGGLLIQDVDTKILSQDDLEVVTEKKPSDDEIETALFTWTVSYTHLKLPTNREV